MLDSSFLQALKSMSEEDAAGPLQPYRRKSWESLFKETKEPLHHLPLKALYGCSFKKRTSAPLTKSVFADRILPECRHSHLVFVDGHFSPLLSDITAFPSQAVLLPLEDALQTHGGFLHGQFTKTMKGEIDPFAHLNIALHRKGVFFYLPPKTVLPSALQCIHLMTASEPIVVCPRMHFVLGALSQMRCIMTAHSLTEAPHLALPTTELFLEESAHLDFFQVMDEPATWHFETTRATLKKNARLHAVHLTLGGKAARQSYHVQLKGKGSTVDLSGLAMLQHNLSHHTHALIDHEAPHTSSLQKFKIALKDHSRSHFEGKILVRPEAQKTEGYQLIHHLLLNQGPIAKARPSLEIFADDVKASHGATVSTLDEEQLLYLRMRGIDAIRATQLLTRSFCREIVQKIPYDRLLKKFEWGDA